MYLFKSHMMPKHKTLYVIKTMKIVQHVHHFQVMKKLMLKFHHSQQQIQHQLTIPEMKKTKC